jgi:peptidoglycan/LPS O-acetylase OafA/YrhL
MDFRIVRYKELDALRGIAALMVVFFHFTLWRPEANIGFRFGTTGVDLFFIISGFVIFMSLENIKSTRSFIISRVSRLYPTYWACVTFAFVLMSINSIHKNRNISFVQYFGNMTMFQHFLGISDIDGPYWTMIVEMCFYISVSFLFYFNLLNHIRVIGFLMIIFILLLVFFLDEKVVNVLMNFNPLLQFSPLFLAGIIFYKLKKGTNKIKINLFILAVCLISQILLFNFSGRSNGFINQIEYAFILTLYFVVFILFIKGKLMFIVNDITLFFGKISFALYLIHQKISVGFVIPFLMNEFKLSFWASTLFFSLPIVIVLATFITYYIEIPFSYKMKRKLKTLFQTDI